MKKSFFRSGMQFATFTFLLNSEAAAFQHAIPHAFTNHLSSWKSSRIQHQFFATVASETSTSIDAVPGEGKVILFDGVCNFCNTWVDILLRIDLNKKFKFTPLQSDIGKSLLVSIGKDADDISSVILVDQGDTKRDYYDKSACVLKVVEELGPLAGVFTKATENIVPRNVRDSLYDMVAENRYNFLGKRDECRCSDPNFADRFL